MSSEHSECSAYSECSDESVNSPNPKIRNYHPIHD